MFSEIETILLSSSVQEIFDEIAAVKYIIWDSWAYSILSLKSVMSKFNRTGQESMGQLWWPGLVRSEDELVSVFSKSLPLASLLLSQVTCPLTSANDHCIGGTMIWSVDQDDTGYTALNDLYPGLSALAPGEVDTGDQCVTSPCGASSCGLGQVCDPIRESKVTWCRWYLVFSAIAAVSTNPALPGTICELDNLVLLCCPAANAPQSCQWRGRNSDSLICNPSCNPGEAILATDPVGDQVEPCLTGEMALCCQTNFANLNFNCLFYGESISTF